MPECVLQWMIAVFELSQGTGLQGVGSYRPGEWRIACEGCRGIGVDRFAVTLRARIEGDKHFPFESAAEECDLFIPCSIVFQSVDATYQMAGNDFQTD